MLHILIIMLEWMKRMIRILSIDGGGMKGIISAIVLERLEELLRFYSRREDAVISDYFDLVGGTSTGSIITALLLAPDRTGKGGYVASDIINLYEQHGKEIFKKRLFFPVSQLVSSKYSSRAFERLLEKYLKGLTLEDLKKDCLITSYDMSRRKGVFFSTLSSNTWEKQNYALKDIVLASAAAPTYFPPRQLYNERYPNNCHIDGGVIANNPAMCLLVESVKCQGFTSFNDVMLLSIGNAGSTEYYEYRSVKHWGIVNWAIPMLNILMDGSEGTVHYQVKCIFDNLNCKDQYLRIEKNTNEEVPAMDAVSDKALVRMIEIGEQLVRENDEKLKAFVKRLVKEG